MRDLLNANGDRDIDMENIDDVVINVAKSDEPVVVIHDEVDLDDDEEWQKYQQSKKVG